MPRQILTLKLDGITAGDYLTWCRDPDPPALGFALRSVHADGDPLGDTITATLDWNQAPPPPPAAAAAAGLPLLPAARIHPLTTWPAAALDRPSAEEGSVPGSPEGTQVRHELVLALTELGGATLALAYHGALTDERLAQRVRRVHDLFTQLNALDRRAHGSHQNIQSVTGLAA